jgi:hypothetical protein
MTQITLALPFALPPQELATDLVRALTMPALATLLARSTETYTPFDNQQHNLPHEAWLSRTFSLAPDGSSAFAAASMRGFGLDPAGADWFMVHPAHVEIARSHLMMHDLRRLRLDDAHARALFDVAKAVFDELGHTLVYGDAHTWFMAAGPWTSLKTSSPDLVVGQNLTDFFPTGPGATDFRRLQNEVQMLWFEHPANVERESAGMPAVNSFWIWAPSGAHAALPATPLLASSYTTPWLTSLTTCPAPSLPDPFNGKSEDSMLIRGDLCEPALAGDWATWLARMHHLETKLFAPALAGLLQGRDAKVRVVLSHRTSLREFTTTKWEQRAFWRKPSLDRLLP